MSRLARLRNPHAVAVVALVVLVAFPIVRPDTVYYQSVLLLAFLLGIQAVSWNVISGYAGYVSLGHSVFLGIGAYTAAILSARWGVNPLVVAPLGGVTAVIAAVLVGLVVLRARGHAFVIITIALLFAVEVLVVNFRGLTHGSDGITLALPSWPHSIQNIPFYYTFLGLLVLTVLSAAWVRRTRFGTGLVAIREDEGKAAAIGINTTRYKVLAYAGSAFFIGVAGGVYAYYLTFLNPVGAFSILASVTIVLSALVGGRGTLYGPVLGAFVVQIVSEEANVYGGGSQSRVLVFGIALVLVVLFLPDGVLPTVGSWWARRRGQDTEYTDHAGALGRGRLELRARQAPASAEGTDTPLLRISGLTKRFGGVVAVDGADLTVRQGSITALIGPNGSGKTTLFNLVTGVLRADSGQILLDGRRVDRLPPWGRGHLGIGRTFQLTRLFGEMTVLENVVAPLPNDHWGQMLADSVGGSEAVRARELLDFVGLGRFAGLPASTLSYGQQKLVELAQALMLEPRLILLDEPAGGVNPSLVARMTQIVRDLSAQGISFLIVEHNIPMVLDLCDPVIVFSRGRVIAQGPPEAIRSDPLVLEAYLGDDWQPPADAGAARARAADDPAPSRGAG